ECCDGKHKGSVAHLILLHASPPDPIPTIADGRCERNVTARAFALSQLSRRFAESAADEFRTEPGFIRALRQPLVLPRQPHGSATLLVPGTRRCTRAFASESAGPRVITNADDRARECC